MGSLRIFVAVDTPPEVKELLSQICVEMTQPGTDVRWEKQEKYHCTLSFLGDVPEEGLTPLLKGVEAAARVSSPAKVSYNHLGSFSGKGRERPTVLWVGIDDPDGRLANLQQSVQEELGALGYPVERRPFTPHVTLGRSKDFRNLPRLLARWENRTLDHPPVLIGEVIVVRSELRPEGSHYTVLRSFPLSARRD
jgi:2'-5' RNA ligase